MDDADRVWLVECLREATKANLNDDFDKMLSRLLTDPKEKVLYSLIEDKLITFVENAQTIVE